ncbi:ATP-binding cassette subfamily B protein [Anoxybacillus voinovskiensis]|uniref:ATP-binding cassette subfamily B protein n=1 Tax=Anoxybacteroides voinovskiense TaxID=230470 RepID=A0A840DSH2_9BACL|nr:ABC transporter ATP-binding protein [Anoxybacillus voinovskiensis]MBB4072499.1 ATP-binding cassette subfamily B protein [Anoxybacillus voinovskiensis]GGJ57413.1 multidrug ABC transporter permease [Anoxybacillus voinovskiensis]
MSVGKRLFAYALQYKKMMMLALFMLAVSVAAELTGPFIAKKVIDQHILGIELPWYEAAKGDNAVFYQGQWYKRDRYFNQGEKKGKEVRVLQVGRHYYFVAQPVAFDGSRSVRDGFLMIRKGGEAVSYPAKKLSTNELMRFYRPEIYRIVFLLGIYMALLVAATAFQYGQRYYLQMTANRIIQKMRNDVFAHIQRLPIRYFDRLPAGKIVARATNDTEAIRELYVTVLATFFTSLIYITGIFIALFLLDVHLAAVCLLLLPILVVWMKVYRKYASKYNHIIRSRLSDIHAMINESIQGMTVIQVFRRQKETEREFEEWNTEYFTYQNKLLSLNALLSHNLVGVLRNVAFVALIWHFGGNSLSGGAISMGVLYAFVDYLNRLFQPVTGMVNQLPNLEQALVAANRVFALLDERGDEVYEGEMPRYKGNVVFENVYFGYKEGEYVLKDITFTAKQGETVALVGHTGSGKSSMMNLLFRFYDIQKGRILIDGVDIQTMPKQWLRKHMGIVLQDPFLFTGTIASNVSLHDPGIGRDKVEQALRDIGAEQLLQNLPNGLDEPVIEKGSTLSSGQRQLISFARALAFDPAILVLDEATSNIDTETEAVIQQALDVLKQGRTTFIIAHRLSTIKNADQILVLDRGMIIERGTHDELMKKKGKYYQMYQLQQGQQTVIHAG